MPFYRPEIFRMAVADGLVHHLGAELAHGAHAAVQPQGHEQAGAKGGWDLSSRQSVPACAGVKRRMVFPVQ